jgi:hypothetical protein
MKTHQRTKAFDEPVIHRKTQSVVFYLGISGFLSRKEVKIHR